MLNRSQRNESALCSPILNLRLRLVSTFSTDGPFRVLRPSVPQVKAGGVVKAAGLNHCVIDCCAGIGLIPGTGLARLPLPVLDGDPETVTVYGSPVCMTRISLTSQSRAM